MQKIKLEARTISILKNFSAINPSMMFKPGNNIATISPSKTVMARATIVENFDASFAIYDMARFLSVLSLFDEPELNIHDKHVVISKGNRQLNYTFADPSTIVAPPEKEIRLPSVDVEFALSTDILANVQKALGIMRLPEIAVVGNGSRVMLQALDSKGSSSDVYSIDLDETDKKFKMIFKAENIRVLPDDYVVQLSSKGISRFKSKDIEYFIAIESNSTFDN
jgi:hypothetical protein